VEWARRRVTRRTFICHVYGGSGAGKSALVDGLIGRAFGSQITGPRLRLACNKVRASAGGQDHGDDKFLIMREFASERVSSSPGAAAVAGVSEVPPEQVDDCDIAVFVYDRTSMASFDVVRSMLRQTAMLQSPPPCVLIDVKADLAPSAEVAAECADLCAELSLGTPVPVSNRTGENVPQVYEQLVSAAMHPHYSVPQTVQRRQALATRRLVRTLLVSTVSVGSVAAAGYFTYRWYIAQDSKAKAVE